MKARMRSGLKYLSRYGPRFTAAVEGGDQLDGRKWRKPWWKPAGRRLIM